MKPRLLKAGHFWRSNDAADIVLGESHVNDVVCIAPTTFSAFRFSYGTEPQVVSMQLEDLEFLTAGIFPRNGLCEDKGSALRYGVYQYHRMGYALRERLVIFEQASSGATAVILPVEVSEAWKTVLYGLKPADVWAVCHTLMRLHLSTVRYVKDEFIDAIKERRTSVILSGNNRVVVVKPREGETIGLTPTFHDQTDDLQYRPDAHPTSHPQATARMHQQEALRNRIEGVGGSPAHLQERSRHQPEPALAAL